MNKVDDIKATAKGLVWRDGECFIYHSRDELEVYPGWVCPAGRNETLPNGNQIIQGIEFDALGSRIAYWLSGGIFPPESARLSCDQCHHIFAMIRPGQVRGEHGTFQEEKFELLWKWFLCAYEGRSALGGSSPQPATENIKNTKWYVELQGMPGVKYDLAVAKDMGEEGSTAQRVLWKARERIVIAARKCTLSRELEDVIYQKLRKAAEEVAFTFNENG